MRQSDPQRDLQTAGDAVGVAGVAGVAGVVGVAGVLSRLDSVLDEVVGLPLEALAGDELGRLVRGLSSATARLDGVRARAVTAAETGTAAREAGAADGAAWLQRETGATPHAAGRARSLGQAMEAVPSLAAALDAGSVDVEQAATLARAHTTGVLDDTALAELVDDAGRLSAGALSRETKRREARTDQALLKRDEGHARRRRRARWWINDDGMVQGDFCLDPIGGAPVITALDALNLPDPADTPDVAMRTPAQRRADALTDMARLTLERGETSSVRTIKPHVTVVVPVTALAEDLSDAEAAGAVGVLDDGTIISAALARQVLCDATVRRLVIDPDGRPLDVGRATRTWSGAQRAASRAIDGGCRGPACHRPFGWTDLHHLTWWRHGGGTGIDNALPLCGICHDLIHHGRWHAHLDPATRRVGWTSPGGQTITTWPRGPAAPPPQATLDGGDRP